MNKQEETLQRVKENLYEFPESLMAQHVLRNDHITLIKLIGKWAKKKPCILERQTRHKADDIRRMKRLLYFYYT